MKRLLIIAAMVCMAFSMHARGYEIGVSLSLCNGKDVPTEAQLREIKDAGIRWVEVTMNPFSRYAADSETYTRAYAEKALLDKVGLKVWSCHLPYGRSKAHNYDISILDDQKREEALRIIEQMIELSAIFHPQRLVLHPSAEPIPDEERAARLQCSRNSICRLALAARRIGAVLCIEDLPRTCLGRNSDEILYLLSDCPEVMCTFDVNHLLNESHDHFMKAVGGRIAHVHISDYDGLDEKHWLEGAEGGIIDWPALLKGLKAAGYKGVFMHEVREGDAVTPASIVKAYREVVCKKKK